MTERWLVTGGSGQVGTALRRNPPAGVEIFTPGRELLDLACVPDDLSPLLGGISAIVNCGAYTAVDKAESEVELAEAVNAHAPGKLAAAAAKANIPIIHVSTDYVFPASSAGPWCEKSVTGPVSVYGRTKLAGEEAVQSSGARYAIVRTAWVVSADGVNFVKTMLRAGAQNDMLRVVADQRGTPTHAGDLAAALSTIALRFTKEPVQQSGIWHFANSDETTWHGLAMHVFRTAAELGLKVPSEVVAITTDDYPTPAQRPADSRLECGQVVADFGLTIRPWQSAVAEIVESLAANK